ncbi:Nif3-like dinuclear metal center hexameric protein [Bacillus spongiae]|uniref:GTP cyclohydrolase 1 type 2 homolog n=1 Tax=Bacillus spongiae TaxID=2683610 RepID=A0ABU8H929_9BACI
MKQANGFEIIQLFEQFSPRKYAVEGDSVGLQIGTLNKKVNKVIVTLDVLDEVVDEAIREKADLIIAHHPPIYRPLKNLVTDSGKGSKFEKLIKHDIAVYVAHTNLDVAPGGVNDLLVDALQLENAKVLVPTVHEELLKLVVYVPTEYEEAVRRALGDAGAGYIGNYSHCSYTSSGEGRFLPLSGSTPFVGTHGEVEQVEEVRIETIVTSSNQKSVIRAMKAAHPYEEPAYDLFSLQNEGNTLGLGRIGVLNETMSLKDFALYVKEKLEVDGVRVVGNLGDKVKKVAVLGGDGNKYIHSAKFKGADVFLTGDLYFHTAHDAMELGLNVVDPGHHVEKVMIKGVAKELKKRVESAKIQVDVIPSTINTNPFTLI